MWTRVDSKQMIREKDGRRLGDLCDWMGETWKLYKLEPESYHIERISNNGRYEKRLFWTRYNDAWLDGSSDSLVWHKSQRKGKQISNWVLKCQ